jgi:hypothetical protein
MNEPDPDKKRHYREMTVANIRERKGADYVEVVFLESTRFYRLSKENPAYAKTLGLLRHAMSKGRVLKVGFASLNSETLLEVEEPSAGGPERNS